jgi:hypothetical protein
MTTRETDNLDSLKWGLDAEISNLGSIGEVLRILGDSVADSDYAFASALGYLANEIEVHTTSARNTYCRLFGFDDFSAQSGGPGPMVVTRGGAA